MGKRELTRRDLLAGLAGASGVGAALGSGTAAMVTDGAIFPGSSLTSGRLVMSVEWEGGGASGSGVGAARLKLTDLMPEQTIDVSLSMPELPGGENNPARVWAGARCRVDTEVTRKLDVTLRRANCSDDCTVFEGSLSELADGVPIDANGTECLRPGETLELVAEVGLTDFEGYGSASFDLEFVGTQCRNDDGRRNPFDGNGGCEEAERPSGHAISFVGFCSSEAGPIEPTFEDEVWRGPGEVESVAWSTDVDVDFVVVKAGTTFTIYDHTATPTTSGEVSSGDPSADAVVTPGPAGGGQSNASRPCALAAEELGHDEYDAESSSKWGYWSGEWRRDE